MFYNVYLYEGLKGYIQKLRYSLYDVHIVRRISQGLLPKKHDASGAASYAPKPSRPSDGKCDNEVKRGTVHRFLGIYR